jgi:hypothetical protein
MSRFLRRIASALFGKTRPEVEPNVAVTEHEAFAPIDSSAATTDWFDGKRLAPRDSIDSNPDTARWYRRPRYVVPGAAVHRNSGSFGGE